MLMMAISLLMHLACRQKGSPEGRGVSVLEDLSVCHSNRIANGFLQWCTFQESDEAGFVDASIRKTRVLRKGIEMP